MRPRERSAGLTGGTGGQAPPEGVVPTIVKSIQLAALIVVACLPLHAQGNYEIQVYGADTVPPGRTMVELHSNFTFEGFKTTGQRRSSR